MSEHEQERTEGQEQTKQSASAAGGTAVKALVAAAAGGAATVAVRKALASRNGHDHSAEAGVASEPESLEDSADQDDEEEDVSRGDGEPESSTDEEDEDEEDEDAEPESSVDEQEDDDDDDPDRDTVNGADRSPGKGSLRQLVNPSMLASASHLLLPLAVEAADSAGRYVAENAPDAVREQIVPRFIKAFEKAR